MSSCSRSNDIQQQMYALHKQDRTRMICRCAARHIHTEIDKGALTLDLLHINLVAVVVLVEYG